jgi:hypothetical protein
MTIWLEILHSPIFISLHISISQIHRVKDRNRFYRSPCYISREALAHGRTDLAARPDAAPHPYDTIHKSPCGIRDSPQPSHSAPIYKCGACQSLARPVRNPRCAAHPISQPQHAPSAGPLARRVHVTL